MELILVGFAGVLTTAMAVAIGGIALHAVLLALSKALTRSEVSADPQETRLAVSSVSLASLGLGDAA